MKKKKHKWKYQINIKKKILVLIILGVSLFVGLGYAVIQSNLNIFGTLEVSKYDKTLYGVMKKDASRNIASTYLGNHIDSISGDGTEAIYYYDEYVDPNNIIFAGTCWEMVRTTDVGGVKLLYNGEPENGQCLDTRGNHVGYDGETYTALNGNYWYGTNYTYDPTTNKFSLKGTKNQEVWSDSTYTTLLGKYTCKSTSSDGTCSSLYYVNDYYNNNRGYVIGITGSEVFRYFGLVRYNRSAESPAYIGYMYGDLGTRTRESIYLNDSFNSSANFSYSNWTVETTNYIADSYDYGQTTAGNYTLTSPTQLTIIPDLSTLIGKYIMNNTTSGTTLYYVVGVSSTTKVYAIKLADGDTNQIINVADSLTDNLNGTYSLDTPTPVDYKVWFANYTDYKNKYTCGGANVSCANPRYMYNTNVLSYDYVSGIIQASLTRNGLALVSPQKIEAGDWYKNYNTTYKDYKYTCGDTSTTCTETSLRLITSKTAKGYTYEPNYYYGESVIIENNKYKLQNTSDLETITNSTTLSTHHYACLEPGAKECDNAVYIYYGTASGDVGRMKMSNGITSAEGMLDYMLKSNTKDSVIKRGLESWYEKFIYLYDDMIEDSIYCNDRTYDTTAGRTFAESGWNDNGGDPTKFLYFNDNTGTDLYCTNPTDRFSTSNAQARTNYKVGLLTLSEANLIGNMRAPRNGSGYHLMPAYQFDNAAFTGRVYYLGDTRGGYAYNQEGLRPSITLKEGTEYMSGTGTTGDPYIVKVEGWSLQSSMFPIESQQWLYLENGKKISNGWHQLNDTHGNPNMYYFENGYSHHGWLELDNNKYYLSTFDDDDNGIIDGRRLTNETREIDGVNYTFAENGVCTNCE